MGEFGSDNKSCRHDWGSGILNPGTSKRPKVRKSEDGEVATVHTHERGVTNQNRPGEGYQCVYPKGEVAISTPTRGDSESELAEGEVDIDQDD